MDFARLNRFLDLSRRFREVSMASTAQAAMGVGLSPDVREHLRSVAPGSSASGAAAALQLLEVHRELESLLGGPAATLPSDAEVRAVMADCLDLAAGAYAMAREFGAALPVYQQAADAFAALGRTAESERCLRKVHEMRASAGEGVDAELAAMHARARGAGAPLERAEAHADLAEASARLGDEHAAREHVEAALRSLRQAAVDPPCGHQLARALRDTVTGDPTAIASVLGARFLFQRLWMTGARVFAQTDPGRAADFRRKLDDSGTSRINEELAEGMLAAGRPAGLDGK